MASSRLMGNNGAFQIIMRGAFGPIMLGVVVSDDEGWDHVSVSHPTRTPTWEEMCYVKDLFFEPEEECVQYHPKRSAYVNYHEHCLHIWRPQSGDVVRPPAALVGAPSTKAVRA